MTKRTVKDGISMPLRLSAADRLTLEAAAGAAHLPLSTWVRQAALRAAEAQSAAAQSVAEAGARLERLRAGEVGGDSTRASARRTGRR